MVRYYPGQDAGAGCLRRQGRQVASDAAGRRLHDERRDRDHRPRRRLHGPGHHNLLFCGDFARKFRLFAQLYKLRLAKTGSPKSENECGDTAKFSPLPQLDRFAQCSLFFARTLAARAGVRSFEVQKGRSETLPVAETEQRHFWILNDLTPWLPRHAGRSPMSVLDLFVLALPFVTGAGTPPDSRDCVQAVAKLLAP